LFLILRAFLDGKMDWPVKLSVSTTLNNLES